MGKHTKRKKLKQMRYEIDQLARLVARCVDVVEGLDAKMSRHGAGMVEVAGSVDATRADLVVLAGRVTQIEEQLAAQPVPQGERT